MAAINSINGGPETSLHSLQALATGRSTGVPDESSGNRGNRQAGPAQPSRPASPDHTPEHLRYLVAEVQRALDTASIAPLSVKFRPSSDRKSYVLELRNGDGEILWQVPAEKALNLRDKLDELSGMVIDEVT